MTSHYLALAASDDGAERGSWELMASVRDGERAQALAEIEAVLTWAEQQAPGPRGAEEDGGLWDADLHDQREGDGWSTLTLTLTGPWPWGAALCERFGLA